MLTERVTIASDLLGEVLVYQSMTLTEISLADALLETTFPLSVDSPHDLRSALGSTPVMTTAQVLHSRSSRSKAVVSPVRAKSSSLNHPTQSSTPSRPFSQNCVAPSGTSRKWYESRGTRSTLNPRLHHKVSVRRGPAQGLTRLSASRTTGGRGPVLGGWATTRRMTTGPGRVRQRGSRRTGSRRHRPR